jgi:hypothetical protein
MENKLGLFFRGLAIKKLCNKFAFANKDKLVARFF